LKYPQIPGHPTLSTSGGGHAAGREVGCGGGAGAAQGGGVAGAESFCGAVQEGVLGIVSEENGGGAEGEGQGGSCSEENDGGAEGTSAVISTHFFSNQKSTL